MDRAAGLLDKRGYLYRVSNNVGSTDPESVLPRRTLKIWSAEFRFGLSGTSKTEIRVSVIVESWTSLTDCVRQRPRAFPAGELNQLSFKQEMSAWRASAGRA